MKILNIKPLMTVEESDLLEGKLVTNEMVKTLIDFDCDVYDKESGKCLAKFRRQIIPPHLQMSAYNSLLSAAHSTDSRGVAGGKDEADGLSSKKRVNKDGRVSKQSIAKAFVNSGVAGYFDRTTRFPNCRLTAFNKHHMDKFIEAYPIIRFVDAQYEKLMPVEYKRQRKMADKTSRDFTIPDTSFTTITVNKNYRTAIHKDAGDYKEGFGNLVALRKGLYEGCHLTLPRWGVAFDMRNGDLLLMDVHQWHGNTPMIKVDHNAVRLSLVMYYREGMKHCGTMREELKRVKNRKKGEPLK